MSRKTLIRTDQFPYHITNRCNNKDLFYVDRQDLWLIFLRMIETCSWTYKSIFWSLVLMDNHYHAIVSTPEANIDRLMRYLQTEISRAVLRKSGRINHVFGGRYRWSLLDTPFSLAYVYKYVYRNPISAGIVDKVQDYPFSTLHHSNRRRFPQVSGVGPLWQIIPQSNNNQLLSWLNQQSKANIERMIERGLSKTKFSVSKKTEYMTKEKYAQIGSYITNQGDSYCTRSFY